MQVLNNLLLSLSFADEQILLNVSEDSVQINVPAPIRHILNFIN
jgi:hypothetical protein